jgi:hypothetical protein
VHAYDPQALSPEQRKWAHCANQLHHRIQTHLMNIAVSDAPLPSNLPDDDTLARLATNLNRANLQLWLASAPQARRVLACANQVQRNLAEPFSVRALAAVIVNARHAAESLVAMTDAQRHTMLTLPTVARAIDIDHDCEAEFDNRDQWRKWVERAHPN